MVLLTSIRRNVIRTMPKPLHDGIGTHTHLIAIITYMHMWLHSDVNTLYLLWYRRFIAAEFHSGQTTAIETEGEK